MSTLTARSPRRVAARDVRHADGSRSLLPAVDLVRASAVVACRGVAEPHTAAAPAAKKAPAKPAAKKGGRK